MKKLIRNIYNLLSISTPFFIIFNYIKNYFPNYRKKKQCLKIDKEIYQNFKSVDISFLKSFDVKIPFSIKSDIIFKNFSELLIIDLI